MTSFLSSALARRAALSLAALCIALPGMAAAADGDNASPSEDSFKAESISVKSAIDDGPVLLVNQPDVAGPSRVHVFSQDGLEYQGELSMGLYSQFIVNNDHSKIYTVSHYLKRYTYGPDDAVLQAFDLDSLKLDHEISVPDKAAMAHGTAHLIEVSADDKYLYIQNATPGTSITVVDLEKQEVAKEVPNPGCFGIYPSAKGHKFLTLCGTGKMRSYDVDEQDPSPNTSDKIFDSQDQPLFVDGARTKAGNLVFPSFHGSLYVIDYSGDKPKLAKKLPLAENVDGDWAPGGYGVVAYNAANDMLFVLAHEGNYNGSHKNPSDEIWAYSLADEKLVSRSKAPDLVSIVATQGDQPTIYGSNPSDGTVDVYTLKDGDGFKFEKTASDDHVGSASSLMLAR